MSVDSEHKSFLLINFETNMLLQFINKLHNACYTCKDACLCTCVQAGSFECLQFAVHVHASSPIVLM